MASDEPWQSPPQRRGRSAPPPERKRPAVTGTAVALPPPSQPPPKRIHVETKRTTTRRAHHGLERLPQTTITEIIGFLRSRDLAAWAEASGHRDAIDEVKALNMFRHYSHAEHHRLIDTSNALGAELLPVIDSLRGLHVEDFSFMLDPRTWLHMLSHARHLQGFEWSAWCHNYGEAADMRSRYFWFMGVLLPRLKRLRLCLDDRGARLFVIQDDVLAADHWLIGRRAGVTFPRLLSLVLERGGQEHGWPATMTRDVAAACPNLRTLCLDALPWTDETLRALMPDSSTLPDLAELTLRTRRQDAGDWMDAKTLVALLRDKAELRRVQLVKHHQAVEVHVAPDRTSRSLAVATFVDGLGPARHPMAPRPPDVPVDTVVGILAGMAAPWTDVIVRTAALQPLVRALVAAAGSEEEKKAATTRKLPRIDSLTILRNPVTAGVDDDWDDADDRPWLSDDDVRGLVRVPSVHCLLSADRRPHRFVQLQSHSDGRRSLRCNRLSFASFAPWIRASPPLTMMGIGGGDDDVPNPVDTPAWSDDLLRVLLGASGVHAASLRILEFNGRERLGDRVWDGRWLTQVVTAYPHLQILDLHDAGVLERFSDALRAMLPRASTTGPVLRSWTTIALRTRDPIDGGHWMRLGGAGDLGELRLTSTATAGGDVLTPLRLRTLLRGTPGLLLLDVDLAPAYMQGSAPTSDWSAIGEHKALRVIRLGRLPGRTLTLHELAQIIGTGAPHRDEVTIRFAGAASEQKYHERHRWAQPAQWSEWYATWGPRVGRLSLGDFRDHAVRAVVWADETFESTLVFPNTETSAPPEQKNAPPPKTSQYFKWLAAQPEVGAQIAYAVRPGSGRAWVFGHPDRVGRVWVVGTPAPIVFVRMQPQARGELLIVGTRAEIDAEMDERPELEASGAVLPLDILPPGWIDETASANALPSRLALCIHYLHLRALNPAASAAALAQYCLLPSNKWPEPSFDPWHRRVTREAVQLMPSDEELIHGSILDRWPTLLTPPVAAGGGEFVPHDAAAPRVRPSDTAATPLPMAAAAAAKIILRDGQRCDALDARTEARRIVHQSSHTIDLARRVDLQTHAQIVRCDATGGAGTSAGATRSITLTVRRPELVNLLLRGPYAVRLAAVGAQLHVRAESV